MNWFAFKTVIVIGLHFLAEYVDRLPESQPSKETEQKQTQGEDKVLSKE